MQNVYHCRNTDNKVYVKIDNINYGSFKVDKNTKIIGCVGSRKTFASSIYSFPASEFAPKKIWNFSYTNADKASVVVALFKHRMFGSDIEIGEIELKISGFEKNTVTTHEFELKCPWNGSKAKVTLSVHVCEDRAPRFTAPLNSMVRNNIFVNHKKFYTQNC